MINLKHQIAWIKEIDKDSFVICCGSQDKLFYQTQSLYEAIKMTRLVQNYYDKLEEVRKAIEKVEGND